MFSSSKSPSRSRAVGVLATFSSNEAKVLMLKTFSSSVYLNPRDKVQRSDSSKL
jgi:hypothetical protein